jgi:hypothetical protein
MHICRQYITTHEKKEGMYLVSATPLKQLIGIL